MDGYVYILEFSRPLHHARYYVGFTALDPVERLQEHISGRGARITQVAVERNIGLTLIHTFPGSRSDERAIKNRKNTPRYVRSLRRQGVIS